MKGEKKRHRETLQGHSSHKTHNSQIQKQTSLQRPGELRLSLAPWPWSHWWFLGGGAEYSLGWLSAPPFLTGQPFLSFFFLNKKKISQYLHTTQLQNPGTAWLNLISTLAISNLPFKFQKGRLGIFWGPRILLFCSVEALSGPRVCHTCIQIYIGANWGPGWTTRTPRQRGKAPQEQALNPKQDIFTGILQAAVLKWAPQKSKWTQCLR